ncbi:MAG TPA: hypothetical protein PKD83_11560 [Ignavibacteria bacterium]|nr:hypothetical protein [Ignavibacteria bacterium]
MAYSQSGNTEEIFSLNPVNVYSPVLSISNKIKNSDRVLHFNDMEINIEKINFKRKDIALIGGITVSEVDPDSEPDMFFSANGGYLKEIEELYNTASIYQKYGINKVFSEKFNLGLIVRIEYAKREEIGFPDITRWYDNTTLNANYTFNDFNNISMFAGYSISDTTFTTYGLTYRSAVATEDFEINNTLTLSDDYFYYWNQVAQNFISDNLNFSYKNFTVTASAFLGVVDLNYIEDYEAKARNPNTLFSLEFKYQLFPDPVVNAGIDLSSRNFKYHSPLYYSPSNRNLAGIFSNFFKSFGKIYLYMGGGMNLDNADTFIWSVDSELGYDYNNFSVSAGISRYNDPFYTNYNTFINLTKAF